MIGPGLPIPAPKVVIDSLASVQVTSSMERSGFQLSFNVGKNSPLVTTMLPAGKEVRDVYLGVGGVLAAATTGSLPAAPG